MAVKPLECLRDYIGIYGCGRPDPASGLYINELGISLEGIDKIANPEQQNFLGVWDDAQTRALRRLNTAVTAYFSQKYSLNKLQELIYLGQKIDEAVVTPAGAQWRGFIYSMETLSNGAQPKSVLQVFDLQQLLIWSPVAGVNISVIVYDVTNKTRLAVNSFVSEAGWNTVNYNVPIYLYQKLFFGYYAVIDGVELKLDQNSSCCACECYVDCCNGHITGATCDALTVNDFDVDEIETVNNTFGMSAVFSAQCSWNNFVCATKSYWANALWYLCAEELMYERMYSSRLNKFTTMGKDEAKERRDEFKARFAEEIQLAVDCVTLDTSDCCIECNQQVVKKEVCP